MHFPTILFAGVLILATLGVARIAWTPSMVMIGGGLDADNPIIYPKIVELAVSMLLTCAPLAHLYGC